MHSGIMLTRPSVRPAHGILGYKSSHVRCGVLGGGWWCCCWRCDRELHFADNRTRFDRRRPPKFQYPSPTSRSLSLSLSRSRVPSWCCALGVLSLWHLCENCECESASERSDPPCLISLVHMPASCGLLACACAECSLITTGTGHPGSACLSSFSL
jgi:hypothetical protein